MRNGLRGNPANVTRLILFIAVGLLHLVLILFFVIQVDAGVGAPDESASVIKLTDLMEEEPPPPEEAEQPVSRVESIAETMIETDEAPNQVVVAPGTLSAPQPFTPVEETYLPMHKISVAPVFSEKKILDALVYPPIALRSGLEGMVYLELFVDRQGKVQRITVLKEDPPNRGFAEAAVKAFTGAEGKPAEANGEAVAVRYRYPVRFSIR
ncbi:MAG: energy transducer TonB [Treponema sp.]|jgi:protein TonB|nr:energy transducer TonB [Treponema sp.]